MFLSVKVAIIALIPVTLASVLAEQPPTQAKLLESIQNAKVIERKAPQYPYTAAKSGREGWVQMSFVIDKDGRVVDPIVEDSSGFKEFEKQALKAVKKWRYQPAIKNGKPIEQCQNTVQMDFRLDAANDTRGVRRRFKRLYTNASNYLDTGDLKSAQQAFDKLTSKNQANMYESAWYWMLAAKIAKTQGYKKRELKASRRATRKDDSIEYLGAGNYLYLKQRIFALEAEMSRYKSALDTFKQIEKADEQGKLSESLRPYALKIEALVSGDEAFSVAATLKNNSKWYYRLARNTFTFDYPAGQLSRVEVRCDNKREVYSIAHDTEWRIPQFWGQCSLYVDGKDGTDFTLIELPDKVG